MTILCSNGERGDCLQVSMRIDRNHGLGCLGKETCPVSANKIKTNEAMAKERIRLSHLLGKSGGKTKMMERQRTETENAMR